MKAAAYISIKVMGRCRYRAQSFDTQKRNAKQSLTRPVVVRVVGRASSSRSNLSGGNGGGLGGLLGLRGGGSVGGGSLALAVNVVVLLAGRVNRDLNGDLAALDLLAVHLGASLLLELLRAECDETEATALAGLATSLELLDHEAGDGAEGDLGLGGGVVLEDFKKLDMVSVLHDTDEWNDVPCPPSGRRAGWQP